MSAAKKIRNDVDTFVDDVLDGLALLAEGDVELMPEAKALRRRQSRKDRPALLIGGGAGHEPLYSGFIGPGFADVAVCGDIFAAPNPYQIRDAARAVDSGYGVLFVYGNYVGDVLNFDMAADLLQEEGIETQTVTVADDVSIDDLATRRGIAGAFYQLKVAGYACDTEATLTKAAERVAAARDNLRSYGVALAPGSSPINGEPAFKIGNDEIEIGMGLHGEPGVERCALPPADELVDRMFDRLRDDLPYHAGDRVAVLINNLGAATYAELMLVYRRLRQRIDDTELIVTRRDIGAFCTSQEMAGFSISLLRLDAELEAALAYPAASPAYVQPQRKTL